MSIEFIDGFEHDRGSYNLKWDITSANGSIGTVAGRFGGLGANPYSGIGLVLTNNQLSTQVTRTVGFAYYNTAPTAGYTLINFTDGGNTQCDLRQNTSGALVVTRNGTTIGGPSSSAIPASTWVYIEFQATINATTGAAIVKVWSGPSPGVWISVSSVNTQTTTNASMNGMTVGPFYNATIDDFYCLNPNGSVNNTFLGESQVLTSQPSGDDASYKQWTPSAGTNHYSLVNEQNQDGDSSYISSATVGQIDMFTMPAVSPSGSIICEQTVLCVRKDAVGTRTVAEQCKSGTTLFNGTNNFVLNSAYIMFREIRENDPNTSAAWTVANLNAAESGIKVIA